MLITVTFMPSCLFNPIFLSSSVQRDSPDDSMKTGAGMVQDKRMDMGSMGDFNGVMGKNPGSRHQLHKESAMDRSPYYDKVHRKHQHFYGIPWLSLKTHKATEIRQVGRRLRTA